MAIDSMQDLRRQTLLVLAQQPEDARHTANAAADLGQQFGSGASAQQMKMLTTAVEAELVERMKMYHSRAFQPAVNCAKC